MKPPAEDSSNWIKQTIYSTEKKQAAAQFSTASYWAPEPSERRSWLDLSLTLKSELCHQFWSAMFCLLGWDNATSLIQLKGCAPCRTKSFNRTTFPALNMYFPSLNCSYAFLHFCEHWTTASQPSRASLLCVNVLCLNRPSGGGMWVI